MRSSKNIIFRRSPLWYKAIGIASMGVGGFILYHNIRLTRVGLLNEGWSSINAEPIALGIAAVEAGVSIFATQPEVWRSIWDALENQSDSDAPKWMSFLFSGLLLSAGLSLIFGAYAFDFLSTHSGLYGVAAGYTFKSSLFTLGYNLGTELLMFLSFQCLRLGKIAKFDLLYERLDIEPDSVYRETYLAHRNEFARQQALDHIRDERDQYARQRNVRL